MADGYSPGLSLQPKLRPDRHCQTHSKQRRDTRVAERLHRGEPLPPGQRFGTLGFLLVQKLVLQAGGRAPHEVGWRLDLRHLIQHRPHAAEPGHVGAARLTAAQVRL